MRLNSVATCIHHRWYINEKNTYKPSQSSQRQSLGKRLLLLAAAKWKVIGISVYLRWMCRTWDTDVLAYHYQMHYNRDPPIVWWRNLWEFCHVYLYCNYNLFILLIIGWFCLSVSHSAPSWNMETLLREREREKKTIKEKLLQINPNLGENYQKKKAKKINRPKL